MSLDPKTNRQTREADKAKQAAEEPPLNVRFPHKRQVFDPFFFGLERGTVDEDLPHPQMTNSVRAP